MVSLFSWLGNITKNGEREKRVEARCEKDARKKTGKEQRQLSLAVLLPYFLARRLSHCA